MKWIRYSVRGVLLLLIVLMLFYLNTSTDDNVRGITEFKIEMFEKIRKDTLDSTHKLNMVSNEIAKFVEESSRIRTGMQRLVGLLVLLATTEIGFAIHARRNQRSERDFHN